MNPNTQQDLGKLILRIMLGALILMHGVAKLNGGLQGIVGLVESHGLPGFLGYFVLIGEVIAPLMVLIGFHARLGALAGIIVGGRAADALRKRFTTGRLWMIVIGMASSIPTAAIAITIDPGPQLYVAGVATLFTFSLYHAPMAATVDDLAPTGKSVAAQGLVIGVMHLLGTAPASWVLGEIAVQTSLTTAMWIPTGILALAALAMALATKSFAADHASSKVARP